MFTIFARIIDNATWFQSHVLLLFGREAPVKCFSKGNDEQIDIGNLLAHLQNRVRPLKNNLAFMISGEKALALKSVPT